MPLLKGTQSAMRPLWPGHYFCRFEKRLPQPEIKSTRPIHLEIRFNPTKCFIRSTIFYWKSLFEQTFTHLITLFYHIWLKTVFKETWTEEMRNAYMPGGRNRFRLPKYQEKWISNIDEQIFLIYISGKWMKKVRYIWKIKRSRPWTFNTGQSLRLRAISHLYWSSNSEVFVDVWLPWKIPSVNSQWYIKNECSVVAYGL